MSRLVTHSCSIYAAKLYFFRELEKVKQKNTTFAPSKTALLCKTTKKFPFWCFTRAAPSA